MVELGIKKESFFGVEDILIGDRSSGISKAIFCILCFVPVFSTVIFGAVDNMTWVVISVFWAAIILLWLTESWKGTGFLLNPSVLLIPLIGLLLIGLIQLLPLGNGGDGLNIPVVNSLSLEPYATRFFVLRLVVYIFFFAACLTFINTEKRLKRIVLLVISFGSLMAFFGILQRLANPDGIYGLRGTPQAIPFGPFVNQHHFAAFMQMTGGLAFGLLFGKDTKRDKKILLAIAVLVMGVAAVLTGSRGGLLGFISVLGFVTVVSLSFSRWSDDKSEGVSQGKGRLSIILAGAALMVVIFGAVLFLGGNESLFRGLGIANADADISSGRTHFWGIALRIFLDHPIIGAGFDAFGVAFTKYDTGSGLFRVEQAHNEYLQTLADAGIAGLTCIVGFIYLLFRKGFATVKGVAGGFRKDATIGALAGCCGVMVHSFFDFPLRTPSNAFFFLLLCAIATVPVMISRKHSTRRRRSAT